MDNDYNRYVELVLLGCGALLVIIAYISVSFYEFVYNYINFKKYRRVNRRIRNRNTGCINCKYYLAEGTSSFISKKSNEHCKHNPIETYNSITGTITYWATNCDKNKDGRCKYFIDVNYEEPIKIPYIVRLKVKLYWKLKNMIN